MGRYINENSKGQTLSATGKATQLINDGARIQVIPTYVPGKSVCVVENGLFDAAAYAYSEAEFNEFYNDDSGRRKTFLEYEHASRLAQ